MMPETYSLFRLTSKRHLTRYRAHAPHVFSSGSLPIILGGDHSIGFPTVRGIAECTSKKIGIIHFDRHADIQEKDLDERMHTTPWFHATNLENVRPRKFSAGWHWGMASSKRSSGNC